MGEQKPEKTKKHICAGLLAHVCAEIPKPYPNDTQSSHVFNECLHSV